MTSILSNRYRSLGTNPSMYESFNPLTTINKQHFVEWFSGSVLDSIWTQTNISGSNTFSMNDSVDGGFNIIIDSSTAAGEIDFNNKRQYEETGSICIAVFRRNTTTGTLIDAGFSGNLLGDNNQKAAVRSFNSNTNYSLITGNVSSGSDTQGSVALDTIFHVHKIECGSANIKLTIDGVLDVTKTTFRPTIPLQPFFKVDGEPSTASISGDIRYLECYNT